MSPTRNYSLQPSGLLLSGRLVPEKATLCHHAGLLLMSPWIDRLTEGWRLLGLSEKSLFYFDPHAEEYTAVLKTLKGWFGGLHRVDKIINMDFIHTEDQPSLVRDALHIQLFAPAAQGGRKPGTEM